MNKRLINDLGSFFGNSDFNHRIISPFSNDSSTLFSDDIHKSTLIMRQALFSKNAGLSNPYNILVSHDEIANLGERYNARYIAYMGLMNYRTLQRKRGENESVYGKLFLFLGAPLAAPQWLSSDILHHYEYQYFSLIYDTKTMKFIALDVDTYKLGLGNEFDESIFLKYNIYNFKQNISSEAK